ncbi:S10 family peptidase [Allosphingosinicella sp.]|uniref:S10 family peptidase n=1 Tax=Allosphingosinicella sp. TaxID=2823234 RepID=UPI002FC24987
MRFWPIVSVFALVLTTAAAAQSGGEADKGDGKSGKSVEALHKDAVAKEAEAGWARAPVEEREVVTRHSIRVGGKTLDYAATAGTLTLRDAVGKPEASIFYTAYTLDGTRPGTKRPIMFFFNGGPGSASLWLHMGSFGPMRLTTGNPEYVRPAPFDFGPNPDTLLGKADLVFIDAPGAGYSRPLGDAKPSDFYGVDQDVDAFTRAILRYVTKFGRWNSPKFLLGESYGTLRSGALAYQLQDRGMALNGVILLSSIMNYGIRQPGFDQIYLTYLPSYTATAWYHNQLPNRPATVEEAVAAARQFAEGPYAAALAKGQTISPEERDAVAQRMSELTGLPADFIERSNLRVDLSRFRKELLRDERLTVGRFDARYTGVDVDAAGENPDFDASSEAISGAYIGSLNGYLTHQLGYETDMTYRLSARDAPGFEWDWSHEAPGTRREQTTPNTAVDLSVAMRTNPYLKVLSLNGYYDMATPFYGTEYDLRHMMLEPAQQRNLEFLYYPAGHMTYLNPEALRQMRVDLGRFIDEAVAEARSGTPPQPPAIAAR